MPVISAQTEARREGYFRREWRLAVDRSHDIADDVMFLLPAVIDGTGENGARVPEKFLTVQWLKIPGGVATPALVARLPHGEHVTPALRSRVPRSPYRPSSKASRFRRLKSLRLSATELTPAAHRRCRRSRCALPTHGTP